MIVKTTLSHSCVHTAFISPSLPEWVQDFTNFPSSLSLSLSYTRIRHRVNYPPASTPHTCSSTCTHPLIFAPLLSPSLSHTRSLNQLSFIPLFFSLPKRILLVSSVVCNDLSPSLSLHLVTPFCRYCNPVFYRLHISVIIFISS